MKGDFGREWFVNAVSTSWAMSPTLGCGSKSVRAYILGDKLLQKSIRISLSSSLTSVLIRWSDSEVEPLVNTQSECIIPCGCDSPIPFRYPTPFIENAPFLGMILIFVQFGCCSPEITQSDCRVV